MECTVVSSTNEQKTLTQSLLLPKSLMQPDKIHKSTHVVPLQMIVCAAQVFNHKCCDYDGQIININEWY